MALSAPNGTQALQQRSRYGTSSGMLPARRLMAAMPRQNHHAFLTAPQAPRLASQRAGNDDSGWEASDWPSTPARRPAAGRGAPTDGGRGGGYRQRGGPRQQYGGGSGGGSGQGSSSGGQRYSRRTGDGTDESGGRGQPRGGGGSWQGPRAGLSPEQVAQRSETNMAIRDARTWRDVARVLAERGSVLDAENIMSMFSKVARERRPTNADDSADFDTLLSSLLGYVLALLPSFRPRHTVGTLTALARMELYSPEVVTGLTGRAAGQMVNFSDVELCSMVSALGKLGQTPPEAFMAEFYTRTTMRFKATPLLKISEMLQALVSTGLAQAAPASWVESITATLEAKCAELPKSLDQARRLHSQGYNRDPTDLTATEHLDLVVAVASLPRAAPLSAGLVEAMLDQQAWRLGGLEPESLTRALWAVAAIEPKPARQWFDTLCVTMARKDWSWEPDTVSAFCLYLGRYLGQPGGNLLCARLGKFATDQGPLLGADGYASLLYVLAVSGFVPDARWLDMALIYMKDALPTASVSGLELLCNALPRLGEGYRLSEVQADATARYNAAVAEPGAADATGGAEVQPAEEQQAAAVV